ncbi:glucosaminidase domain-containing protein [uncultured Draconibacterium sp.]|uniref:glucosaminidase domain-containing protein n=1 Tax=uncultured Draconibacterium sp. TaxID=1573823 RepID=UPI0029C87B56|nr:glucosaminidase domain-containing protein [uncultured Draconibacterium sp.]
MRHIISFFLFILLASSAFSQNITRDEYIRQWQLVAIEEMNRSGIPASITMAQGCLESGNGNSELSRESNNHFGIKCKSSWKGKKVYYDDDRRNECFRSYRSVKDSYIDHTNFLMENPRYASLFLLDPTDYKSWAKGLKKAGYATAHDYDKRLIRIIEENKLHRLDKKMTFSPMGGQTAHNALDTDKTGALTIRPFYTHKVTKINHVKAVVAQKGDTYEILAQELGLKDWELYKFNDQSPGHRPIPNEVVYIQYKKSKSSKNQLTHRAQEGETMHYISQLYGIKLKPLYRRNNMKKGEQPQVGQVIYLRKKKK